ncbi:MAG: 4-hydroxy-tetrahydrodipicolinate reductase [Bacteroidales bacterium]|nr:4-hydroxy-tetrahydrodipicolinate reductase [Bacteroidales bacterium]MBR6928612.1 4-hydroxy-tetrahydrodipicolinate reductase [Bacteroidales bacterium]
MKIALIGYGKMGHEVEKAALARQHSIVVTIDNAQEWKERFDLLKQADVAIEFSQPDQVVANIHRCFDLHLPIVVGTTAWQDHFEEIKQRCLAEQQSLFTAPNFSIGMNIMFLLNKQLARFAEQYGYQLSLAETHHIHKLDKPSGTAVKLANDIMAVDHDYDRWSIDAPSDHTLYINVVREGEVFGIHSVNAQSSADRITITHEAFNRQGLAAGALAAAEFLVGKTGVFGMEDLFRNV